MWQTLVTERKVPLGSVQLVMTAFWSAGQDDLLKPAAEAFLELVPDLHSGGTGVTGDSGRRSTLLDRADRVRRMLRSRGWAIRRRRPAGP